MCMHMHMCMHMCMHMYMCMDMCMYKVHVCIRRFRMAEVCGCNREGIPAGFKYTPDPPPPAPPRLSCGVFVALVVRCG